MNREDAIRLLKGAEPELRARGVTSLALFGSTARGDARPDSDVDLLVELDENAGVSLIGLSGIKFLASDLLGVPADVTIRESVRPRFRRDIEADAIPVF
jgi:uncharacterized protein